MQFPNSLLGGGLDLCQSQKGLEFGIVCPHNGIVRECLPIEII